MTLGGSEHFYGFSKHSSLTLPQSLRYLPGSHTHI